MREAKERASALLEEAAPQAREDVRASLRELGLSGYAVGAFVALLSLGETTAGELVTKTGVPDSKIYYALDELAEKGVVEVQAGKPKTYRVVPPREVEERLRKLLEARHERELASLRRVGSLLEPLRAAAKSPSADIAYIVKGQTNVLARARSLVASARKEIVLLSSQEFFVRALEAELSKVARRRVKVKIAAPDLALDKELDRLAERRTIVCTCTILVVDGVQVLTVSGDDEASRYGLLSTDGTLVRLALDYWQSPRCCGPASSNLIQRGPARDA